MGARAVWTVGYRPFFLLAATFAPLAIVAWVLLYTGHQLAPNPAIAGMTWHAHEMVFAYAGAVIAGFLLTAVRNWTGRETASGLPLALLALCWLLPRGLLMVDQPWALPAAAVFDCLFFASLLIAVGRPIFVAKQWRNMGVLAKVVFLLGSQCVFYLGVLSGRSRLVSIAIYSAFYIIIALILVMARRLIPFFVERACDQTLKNRVWLDRSSLALFVAFWVFVVFYDEPNAVAALSAGLFVLHALRLSDWYTPSIWSQPLIWVLYASYAAIVLAFSLTAIAPFAGFSPLLAVHAFAIGGIGVMTLGMMARVSWGHSGRKMSEPPVALPWVFLPLIVGFVFRSLMPIVWPTTYTTWIVIAGVLWAMSFVLFIVIYAPVLTLPRVDAAKTQG